MKPAVLGSALFATSVSIVLVACGAPWSISSVRVNPQPISGTDPVLPVVLVAPQETGISFEIVINRDGGFQSPIDISADVRFSGDWIRITPPDPRFTIPGSSNRGSGTLLTVSCTRLEASGGPPTVKLDAGITSLQGFNILFTATDPTVAKTSVDIRGVSTISGSNDPRDPYVEWSAPHPLEISCFLQSPIN